MPCLPSRRHYIDRCIIEKKSVIYKLHENATLDGGKLYFLYFGKTGRQRHTSQKERKYTVNHGKYGLQPNPPLRATIDPNYQKRFSQSLIVEISRKRAPLESDREHFWGIHFYNFPLFSSLLQVDLLPSGASLV